MSDLNNLTNLDMLKVLTNFNTLNNLTNFDILNALCKAAFGAGLDPDEFCECDIPCLMYPCPSPRVPCYKCKYENFWNKEFDPSYLFRKEGGDINGNECTD